MSDRPTLPFDIDADKVGAQREKSSTPPEPADFPVDDRIHPDLSTRVAAPEAPGTPPPTPRRPLRVFLWTAATLLLTLLVVETTFYAIALIERSAMPGLVLAALAVATLVTGLYAGGAEFVAFRRQRVSLKGSADLREEAQRILENTAGEIDGRALAKRVINRYEGRQDTAPGIKKFELTVTGAHDDREVLSLLVREVLQPLDRQAYRIISRAARDTGIAVALSPAGLLDALLVIWRTSRMIRDVALVYGFRPGRIGRLALTRRVLENAAMAGATEYFGDLVTAHIGAGVAGRLSSRVGQSAFTALRTARLGLVAMESCRPVPFTPEDRASLSALRSEVLGSFRTSADLEVPLR